MTNAIEYGLEIDMVRLKTLVSKTLKTILQIKQQDLEFSMVFSEIYLCNFQKLS